MRAAVFDQEVTRELERRLSQQGDEGEGSSGRQDSMEPPQRKEDVQARELKLEPVRSLRYIVSL